MNDMIAENLIKLSFESDSNNEFDELLLFYSFTKYKKLLKSNFIKKKSHGLFNLFLEFFDQQFSDYFHLKSKSIQ